MALTPRAHSQHVQQSNSFDCSCRLRRNTRTSPREIRAPQSHPPRSVRTSGILLHADSTRIRFSRWPNVNAMPRRSGLGFLFLNDSASLQCADSNGLFAWESRRCCASSRFIRLCSLLSGMADDFNWGIAGAGAVRYSAMAQPTFSTRTIAQRLPHRYSRTSQCGCAPATVAATTTVFWMMTSACSFTKNHRSLVGAGLLTGCVAASARAHLA